MREWMWWTLWYGNALRAAAWRGQVKAIHLFLDRGADVNAQGGRYGTALQAALVQPEYNNILKNPLHTAEIVCTSGLWSRCHSVCARLRVWGCFKCCKNTLEA